MKDSAPQNYSPQLDAAKSEAMRWLHEPKTRQDIRTFSHVGSGAPYVFSAFVRIMNYMKQLCEATLIIQCVKHGVFHTEDETTDDCLLSGFIDFELDDKLEDELAKAFVDDILLLSPASNGKRAIGILDMLKNMNRPSMPNLMGMLGNQSDETDSPPMEVTDSDDE